MQVLVGIPTYNGAQRVDWLLQSISMMTNSNIDYKIVIIDDSGNKHHQEKVKLVTNKWNSSLPINLLINDKNVGVAKSWNKIIRSEDSQYIILINDDIIVDQGWLDSMVYFLDNNPDAGVAFYNHFKIDENDIPRLLSNEYQLLFEDFQFDDLVPIRCMHFVGCFFGFSREKYDIIGGFDENYFANFEETDFCTALASRGYPNYILRYPIFFHIGSATFKSAPEINYLYTFEKSKQYYKDKWSGDREAASSRYMSKIPFQKVKWACNDNTYEEILTDKYGYFKIELENDNIKIIN